MSEFAIALTAEDPPTVAITRCMKGGKPTGMYAAVSGGHLYFCLMRPSIIECLEAALDAYRAAAEIEARKAAP